jgi:hypothetical protein
MKLRAFRRWPALFVAVLAFFTGPMAYGADDRSVAAIVSGAIDGGTADSVLLDTLHEVSTLCRAVTAGAENGNPGARECRQLADRIDAAVAHALGQPLEASVQTQRALAGLLVVAEAMRSADNRVRKAALSGIALPRRSGTLAG